MSHIHVLRGGQSFGPYDAASLGGYVASGHVLAQDLATDTKYPGEHTVGALLKHYGQPAAVPSGGGLSAQVRALGWDLLLPRSAIRLETFRKHPDLLLLSVVGLAPAFLIRFTGAGTLTFYAIALYFSLIWGLFYYETFKTEQVDTKLAISLFFGTQALVFFVWDVLGLPNWQPFYRFLDGGNFFGHLIGYTLGVGLTEEFVKVIGVYVLCRIARGPLVPKTAVFYGLVAGIGFGVFEGVQYQLTANAELEYGASFFMNIARLTSLPFLHSIWTAIASYFVALAFLFPRSRWALLLVGLAIPSLLHGLYDVFTWSLPGLVVAYLGVGLLVLYLRSAGEFQQRLRV